MRIKRLGIRVSNNIKHCNGDIVQQMLPQRPAITFADGIRLNKQVREFGVFLIGAETVKSLNPVKSIVSMKAITNCFQREYNPISTIVNLLTQLLIVLIPVDILVL